MVTYKVESIKNVERVEDFCDEYVYDVIMEDEFSVILTDLPLNEEVKAALLGEKNTLFSILDLVSTYEAGNIEEISKKMEGFSIDMDTLATCYLKSVVYTDQIFNEN